MKRFLLWVIGVALGVTIMLAAVLGVCYSFTKESALPDATVTFGTASLEVNGSCWYLPLVGGVVDKVFEASPSLTVQKLGTLYDAHPELDVPAWATSGTLTITEEGGETLFDGSLDEYETFLYPSNGNYKAELVVWRLPDGMAADEFEPANGHLLHRNADLEHPARATGYYIYRFRFTLQAAPEVTLSAERVEQGGVVGMQITGMVGTTQPTVETDLGSVQCVRMTGGWRAYIPAAYNASAGAHEIAVTVNDTVVTRTITVVPHDFGTAETEAEGAASEAANEEFRGAVWPLYEQAARAKQWKGSFLCPVESYLILVDYGQVKQVDGVAGSRSNSTLLYTLPGAAVRAPAAGQVVLARELALTGNTVVIDHGCGMRSYLYGLAELDVKVGDTVERGQTVGTAGEELTMDFKLGSKSVNPWNLFQAAGGLFWKEDS